MNVFVSTSGYQSLTLSRSHQQSLPYHNPRQTICPSPTHAASSAMPYECSLIVVPGYRSPYRRLVSIVSGYLCPCHDRTLSVVLPGGTLTGTSTYSSTYPLVQDSPSVGSLDTQGSVSRLYIRKRRALSVPYLLTAFHGPIHGVVARLVRLATAFHKLERLWHPIPSQRWPISAGLASARGGRRRLG